MPVSRPFDETVISRASRDREFARGLLIEAIAVLGTEPEAASVLIGHYMDGAGDIDRLAASMERTKDDARSAMLNPGETSFVTYMQGLHSLCAAERMAVDMSGVAPDLQPVDAWSTAHHRWALARIEELMDAMEGSPEAAELTILAAKVASYEQIRFPIRKRSLIEFWKDILHRLSGRKPWE